MSTERLALIGANEKERKLLPFMPFMALTPMDLVLGIALFFAMLVAVQSI